MIFLTSDTHWEHGNIIKYCQRPFKDHEEMGQTIIDNINSMTSLGDDLYHLGDFGFFSRSQKSVRDFIKQIKCKVHIIFGNHDRDAERSKHEFASCSYGIVEIKAKGQKFVLCHYPLLSWNARSHGRVSFFGHVHSSPFKSFICQKNSCDVGVDAWNFRPVPLDDAIAKAQDISGKLKIMDAHDQVIGETLSKPIADVLDGIDIEGESDTLNLLGV
jgi:calcineurin-like phosphoesterase family protein